MKQPTIEQLQEEIKTLAAKNAKLEKNKHYYQIISENTSDIIGINTFDLKAEYLYISPSVKKVLGYEPKELVGRSFFDFIHPDDKKIIFQLLRKYVSKKIKKVLRVKNSDVTELIEFRYKDKAGNWRYLQSTVNFFGSNLIGITRDISCQKEAQTKLLQRENYLLALNKAKQVLLAEFKEDTLQKFVEILGVASNASRTYIFKNSLNDDGKLITSQKAEYCAMGIEPEIDNPMLQGLKYDDFIPRWEKVLSSGELILGKVSNFPKSEKEILESQQIKAILVIPIIINNNFLGFIGFDNCISERKWDNAEQNFLRSAADDFAQFIERTKINFQIKNENKRFQATMDALDAVVYVSDMDTYEILYLNKFAKSLTGNNIGNKCFLTFQNGQAKPCSFCTNHLLLDDKGNPKETHVWEFQNTKTKRWYQLRDQAIHWPDGRVVRLEIAVDISERKKTEDQLRQSESSLKEAQYLSKTGSWRFEIDNKQLSWSNEVYNIFQVEKHNPKSLYNTFFNTIHPEDRELVFNAYTKSVESKIPYNIIHRLLLDDGTIKIVNERCKTYYKNNDEPIYSIGTVQDITEQIKKEEELKEAKDFAENLLETANSIIVTLDKGANILMFNKYAEKVTGYTKEEVIGKNWFDIFIPEEYKKTVSSIFKGVLSSVPSVSQHENPIIIKNREKRIISWNNNVTYNVLGNISVILSIGEDITERKKTEAELHNSSIQLKATLKALPDLLFEMDINGRIYGYQAPKNDLLYVTPENFLGKTIFETLPPDVAQIIGNAISEASKTGIHTGATYALPIPKGKGWFELSISKKEDTQTTKGRFIVLVRDITDRKIAEIALAENEDKFRSIFETTVDGILYVDNSMKVIDVNPAFITITGIPKDELIGNNGFKLAKKFCDIKQLPSLLNLLKQVLLNKTIKSYEIFYNNKILNVRTSRIKKNKRYIGIIRDVTESRKVEIKLHESEKKLRTIIDSTSDAIVLHDFEGKMIMINKGFHQRLGYTYDEAMQLTPMDIDTPEYAQIVPEQINKLMKHGHILFETEQKSKGGKIFPMEVNARIVRLDGKKLILSMGRDISERKKSERALRESEEKYRTLFETIGEGILTTDLEENIIYCNPAADSIFGVLPNKLIYRNMSEFTSSSRFSTLQNETSLRKEGKKSTYETEITRPDGEKRQLLLTVTSQFDKKGNVIGCFGTFHDITQRKKAELALQESESRFKALSRATNEAIIFIENGVIIEINESACNMSGYTYNEFIGRLATDFISDKSIELVKLNMITEYDKPYDAIAKRKDGTEFHVEVQGRMLNYKGRKIRISSLRDITERKEYEDLLKKNADKLKQLNTKLTSIVKKEVEKNRKKDHMMIIQSKQAAMGEMISNIAHQWRQPLNDVGLYIQRLQDSFQFNELTSDELNSTVEKTMNKLDYMSHTIDDFRNFFHTDKKKVLFSLTNSIYKTLTLTEASLKNNNIQITLDLQENVFITGYPNEFSQAMLNILNNAKDALVDKKIIEPQLKVQLSKINKKSLLIISDNAGGIEDNIINKVFEPYFTTKSHLTGTGLGLYISKTIIERNMQGRLIVRNKNNWTEFVIEFDC